MADGGKVIIKIDGDDSGFRKVSGGLGSFAQGAFKAVGAGAAVAAGAVAAVGTASVKAYSDYEQLKGGVETLFKSSAGTLMGYANQAYQTAGMSANRYMETVTSFSASMIQSLGGDTAAAAELSNKAIIDMSDNANKMGTSIDSIIQTYQSLSRGNFAMLDNLKLGYGGTKKELQRLLADAEKYKKSMGEIVNYDVSNFADITEAIGAIQQKLGIAGTTALEASTTIQGSAMAMKAAWDNLLVGMSDPTQDMDALMENLVTSVETFAGNLMPVVNNALSGISGAVSTLLPQLIGEVPNILENIIPDITAGVGGIVDAVIEAFTGHKSIVGETVAGLFTDAIDSIKLLTPAILPVTAAITGYTAAVGLANTATTLFTTVTTALSNPIGMIGAALGLGTAAIIGIKTAIDEANMSFYTMGEELTVLSENYSVAKENALITEEYANSWYELSAAIDSGTLPAEELAAAEAERKGIEQWFIENYGAFIDAEEEKNGIRKDTIGLIQEQCTEMTKIRKLELENQVLEMKSRVPELQKEINSLDDKNKKLSTQNTELLTQNNTVLKATSEWRSLTDEQKASGAYQNIYKKAIDDVNKALGTNFTQMEEINSAVEINKKAIQENEVALESNSAKLDAAQQTMDAYKTSCKQLIEIDIGTTLENLSAQIDIVKQAQAELEEKGTITKDTMQKLAEICPELADALGSSSDKSGLLKDAMDELQGKFETAKQKAQEFGGQLDELPDTVTVDLVFNVPKIPQLAKGTKGAKRGLAVVNDGNGPELIQSRDGTCRIIDSDGSVLTWLNDGDRVYTAEQTRTMMRNVPHYANGVGNDGFTTGNVKITKYIDNIPKAFEKALDDIELQRDLDVIDEAEYYLQLESLRDKYLEKGTDKWWEYTVQIYDYKKSLAEEEKSLSEKARDDEFNSLENLLKRQFITEDEYYDSLSKLRDKHFKQGTDEWQEYTDAISDYQLSKLNDMKKSATEAIEALGEEREAFQDKLEENFSLLQQDEKGMYKLADLSVHSAGMKEYYNNLKKLKEIVPERLYNQIRNMSTQEGGSFMYTFFAASEKEQEKFVDDFKQVFCEAADVSTDVYADEASEIHQQITDEFSKTPEEFFQLGHDSIEQFGNGFIEGLSDLMGNMRRGLNVLLENLVPGVEYGGGNSNVYTDNSSITIIAGSKSEREIIEELETRKQYEKQVRGW